MLAYDFHKVILMLIYSIVSHNTRYKRNEENTQKNPCENSTHSSIQTEFSISLLVCVYKMCTFLCTTCQNSALSARVDSVLYTLCLHTV